MNEHIGEQVMHIGTGEYLTVVAYDLVYDRFKCKFGSNTAMYSRDQIAFIKQEKPMKHDRDELIAKGAIAMYDSLNIAVQQAGGTIYTWEQLESTSVTDLLLKLGTNSIRFNFKKPVDINKKVW